MLIRWRFDFLALGFWGFRRRGIAWSTVTAMGNWSSRSRIIGRYVNRCRFFLLFLEMWGCVWNLRARHSKFLIALDDGFEWKIRICHNVKFVSVLMRCNWFWKAWRRGMHVSIHYAGSDWRHNLCPCDILTNLVNESCIGTVLMCFKSVGGFRFSNCNLHCPWSIISKSGQGHFAVLLGVVMSNYRLHWEQSLNH